MRCNKCNIYGFFKDTKRLAQSTGAIVRNYCVECNNEFNVSTPDKGISSSTKRRA